MVISDHDVKDAALEQKEAESLSIAVTGKEIIRERLENVRAVFPCLQDKGALSQEEVARLEKFVESGNELL